jgi:hypothetical protein
MAGRGDERGRPSWGQDHAILTLEVEVERKK